MSAPESALESAPEKDVDPVTAALPPNSDYITYLTILEYQLTAERLPTLTKHLATDDGTLAKEIGWDLVRLVLPLLRQAPEASANCLECISRRGNPREVIVRVAESLEALGTADRTTDSASEEQRPDDPPTIPGEAERVHLGKMDLGGTSQLDIGQDGQEQAPQAPQAQGPADGGEDTELLSRQLSNLLSMLGLLHSRIRTQYPSRFLATSLPAALGAYRRIPITIETTTAFVALLGKLSGKQRPTLPPRTSTASVSQLKPGNPTDVHVDAPLPDPEGGSAENAKTPSDLESSIVLRLLQAVMLEVLEEYLSALPSSMEWAARSLEKQFPNKTPANRRSRSETWREDKSFVSIDALMTKFTRLAKDLNLDPEQCFRATNLPLVSGEKPEDVLSSPIEERDADEPYEYPTSPDQIPYSHLGALFLFLAGRMPKSVSSESQNIVPALNIPTSDLHHFLNQFVLPSPVFADRPLIPSVIHNPSSALDALLAFIMLCQSPPASDPSSDEDYASLITILSYLSAQHPDPSLRSSAHHLASSLLHDHRSSKFRLSVIKTTLANDEPFENLKEVAVNWLKEELLATVSTGETSTETSTTSTSEDKNIFSSPDLLAHDETLTTLLFPDLPTPPLFTSPPEPGAQEASPIEQTLPIASLNLLFLLLSNPTLKKRYNLAASLSPSPSDPPPPPTSPQSEPSTSTSSPFSTRASTFLRKMRAYVDENGGKGSREQEGRLALLGMAVGRVEGALQVEQGT